MDFGDSFVDGLRSPGGVEVRKNGPLVLGLANAHQLNGQDKNSTCCVLDKPGLGKKPLMLSPQKPSGLSSVGHTPTGLGPTSLAPTVTSPRTPYKPLTPRTGDGSAVQSPFDFLRCHTFCYLALM